MSQISSYNLTIILTSRENYVWSSMQEIVPSLERTWLLTANNKHQVKLLNVDEVSFVEVVRLSLRSNNIVVTTFTHKICKYIEFVRENLKLNTKIVFHLHGMTSIGLWPMWKYGMLKHFTTNDIFISSCERDGKLLKSFVLNANLKIIPFGLPENIFEECLNFQKSKENHQLYFVGRISRQKNIHLLIKAVKKLKDFGVLKTLNIFGTEDHLGSPNMGWKDTQYLTELKNLVKDLEIEENVIFHGFVDREIIYNKILKEKHIFVCASAHSDENFGMALLRALVRGEVCVVSNWGGHSSFKSNFPNQIFYFAINEVTNDGMSADVDDIVKLILEAQKIKLKEEGNVHIYREMNISKHLYKILEEKNESEELEFSNEFYAIQRAKESNQDSQTKIFENYLDELALFTFRHYGLAK